MTAADLIRPFVEEADRRKPALRIDNRFPTCFELLELSLALAGKDFQFVGKSGRKGEAGWRPAWFTPTWIECRRPDGQVESVFIDQLGMDAAWHMPTMRQVKVITNSTANELPMGDPRRGPAGIDSYDILPNHPETGEPQYRWHNPPIPQGGLIVVPPMPAPGPAPGPHPPTSSCVFPPQDEAFAFGSALNAKYKTDRHASLIGTDGEGVQVYVNLKGMAVWLQDYLRLRTAGRSHADAQAEVFRTIDQIPL